MDERFRKSRRIALTSARWVGTCDHLSGPHRDGDLLDRRIAVQEAAHVGAVAELDEGGRRLGAALHALGATLGEPTAGWWVDERRHPPGNHGQLLVAHADDRDRAEQSTRVGMLRIGEQRLDRRLLDDLAAVHHGDAVRRLGDDAEIVGDQHHARAPLGLQCPHQVEDLRLDRDVESRRRLVGDEQLRLGGEGHGDHHPLGLAPRELVRVRLGPPLGIGDADGAQHLDGLVDAGSAPRVAVDLIDLADLHAGREARMQAGVGLLEDHRNAIATQRAHRVARQSEHVDAVERHRSGDDPAGLVDESQDGKHRDALAAARLTDETEHLALAHREVDAIDGMHLAGPRVEPGL